MIKPIPFNGNCLFCNTLCIDDENALGRIRKCPHCSQDGLIVSYSGSSLIHEIHFTYLNTFRVYIKPTYFLDWKPYWSNTWYWFKPVPFNDLDPNKFKELCNRMIKLKAFW